MIAIITAVNLSAIDLNLLLVLSVVLEERSATRAAERLHVTQSAVSNALARLRELLGDPLVVRNARGLTPTPRAQELAPLLAAAVAQLQRVVDGAAPFDAQTCTRTFSLACADGQQLTDLPPIARALEHAMPLAKLRVVSIDALIANDGLASGDVDVAIAPQLAHPGLSWIALYADDPVALVRRAHPIRGKSLTKAAFAATPQVDLHVALGRPGVGNAMAEKLFRDAGLTREVVLSVPSFAAAAMAVATTDWLVCMPRRVARALAASLDLRLLELPLPRVALELGLVWHVRTDADPASRAFRELLVRTLRSPAQRLTPGSPARDRSTPARRRKRS